MKSSSQDSNVFKHDAIHKPILREIIELYPDETDTNSCPDSIQIGKASFDLSAKLFSSSIFDGKVVMLSELFLYCGDDLNSIYFTTIE